MKIILALLRNHENKPSVANDKFVCMGTVYSCSDHSRLSICRRSVLINVLILSTKKTFHDSFALLFLRTSISH
jgi:hypothetical protein